MDNAQNTDVQYEDSLDTEETSGITPEQQAEIDRIKRRNLIIAAVFGIILLVLGFFAGRYARQQREDSSILMPSFSVCDVLEKGEQTV